MTTETTRHILGVEGQAAATHLGPNGLYSSQVWNASRQRGTQGLDNFYHTLSANFRSNLTDNLYDNIYATLYFNLRANLINNPKES